MKQALVIELRENIFLEKLGEKLKEGYKIIAGSTFIESYPWKVSTPNGELLDDVGHVITVAIAGKHDFMVYAKDIHTFRKEVNAKLASGMYKIVVGSLATGIVKKDGFDVNASRIYLTYYGCALYKE